MKTENALLLIFILIVGLFAVDFIAVGFWQNYFSVREVYAPVINPLDFSTSIDNKYFSLTPGAKFVYEGKSEEGVEKIEVYVTNETREVIGVNAVVVWDRVWLNGNLIEDTKDWYAQDKEGNVWYFGEESKEIVLGEIVSREGSWEAGIDGAKPGIIMKANPKVGESYYQEYYKGRAEDRGEVVALKESVSVPYGTFDNCLKTRDYTTLEPDADEYKYYCPDVGNVVLERGINSGENVELINVEKNSEPAPADAIRESPSETGISEEKAKEIALKEVSGTVTDVSIEMKFSKKTYVVEIDASGTETDVIIDFENGEVLGVER